MNIPTLRARLAELAAKATQGEWITADAADRHGWRGAIAVRLPPIVGPFDYKILLTGNGNYKEQSELDAAFVCKLRNNVDLLLAALKVVEAWDELQAARTRLAKEMEKP